MFAVHTYPVNTRTSNCSRMVRPGQHLDQVNIKGKESKPASDLPSSESRTSLLEGLVDCADFLEGVHGPDAWSWSGNTSCAFDMTIEYSNK